MEEFSGIQAQLFDYFVNLRRSELHASPETVTDSVVTQEFRERGISVCTTSSENVSTTNAK